MAEPITSGGLLAALRSVVSPWNGGSGATWIGVGKGRFDDAWVDDEGFEFIPIEQGVVRHRRLFVSADDWAGHYSMVANAFLWPLLHLARLPLPEVTGYYPSPRSPDERSWEAYERVNAAFAAAAQAEGPATVTWIHDYHLALAPARLRAMGHASPIGFFLHTTFPDPDMVERECDARGQQLFRRTWEGMLGADRVGLQSEPDVERFIETSLRYGARAVEGGIECGGRRIAVGAHPIGIDERPAAETGPPALPEVARPALAVAERGVPLVVGLERTDYTKGIPERHRAIARAFDRGGRFAYLGVSAPTREHVPGYGALREAVESTATEAAAAARDAGGYFRWSHHSLTWGEVTALLERADAVFTSSLADGLNLVPLQAVLAQAGRPEAERGVVVAGRDAGISSVYAEYEGEGLIIVEPTDADAMLGAVFRATTPTTRRISDRFVAAVRANGARAWAESFLTDLESTFC